MQANQFPLNPDGWPEFQTYQVRNKKHCNFNKGFLQTIFRPSLDAQDDGELTLRPQRDGK